MGIFHSMTKPDCLDKGHLINELGYRYNATFNIESAGNITCINSLAALKKLVFDEKKYSQSLMSSTEHLKTGNTYRLRKDIFFKMFL